MLGRVFVSDVVGGDCLRTFDAVDECARVTGTPGLKRLCARTTALCEILTFRTDAGVRADSPADDIFPERI